MGKTVKVHTGSGRFWHINDESNICQSVGVNKKSTSSQVFCIWNLVSSKVGLALKKSSPWKTFWPSKTIPSNTHIRRSFLWIQAIPEPDLRFDLDVWQQGSIHENIPSVCFLKLRTSVIDMQRGWLVLTWRYPCNKKLHKFFFIPWHEVFSKCCFRSCVIIRVYVGARLITLSFWAHPSTCAKS